MNLKNRSVWFGILAVLAIVLLTIVSAPGARRSQQGSTYSRSPSGYGAWYAYMQEQGTELDRWQRPLNELFETGQDIPQFQEIQAANPPTKPRPQLPVTLVQISNGTTPLLSAGNLPLGKSPYEALVEAGNTFVLIGVRSPAVAAPFSSQLKSPAGAIKIETTRRLPSAAIESAEDVLLRDAAGAIVWQQRIGRGRMIYVSTPFLAANAYQDAPGNFKFLANLVNAPGNPIWVDEYLHGYVDPPPAGIRDTQPRSLLDYLLKTPLPIVITQAIVILLVMIVGFNQRLGRAVRVTSPTVDNSEAYIAALAAVLQKANSSEFVVATIGKAEQIALQRSLGLGVDPVEITAIATAWEQQTGRSANEIEQVLRVPVQASTQRQRLTPLQLANWLAQLQVIRSKLPR